MPRASSGRSSARSSGTASRAPSRSSSRTTTRRASRESRSTSCSSTTGTSFEWSRSAGEERLEVQWEQLAHIDATTLDDLVATLTQSLELLVGEERAVQRAELRKVLDRHRRRRSVTLPAVDAPRSTASAAYVVLDDDDRIAYVSASLHDEPRALGRARHLGAPAGCAEGLRADLRRGPLVGTAGRVGRLLLGHREAPDGDSRPRRSRGARRAPRRARPHESRDVDA